MQSSMANPMIGVLVKGEQVDFRGPRWLSRGIPPISSLQSRLTNQHPQTGSRYERPACPPISFNPIQHANGRGRLSHPLLPPEGDHSCTPLVYPLSRPFIKFQAEYMGATRSTSIDNVESTGRKRHTSVDSFSPVAPGKVSILPASNSFVDTAERLPERRMSQRDPSPVRSSGSESLGMSEEGSESSAGVYQPTVLLSNSSGPSTVVLSAPMAGNLHNNRRQAHIASEQKRRQSINEGFEDLRHVIPACANISDSKAVILRKAVNYVRQLQAELVRAKIGCDLPRNQSSPLYPSTGAGAGAGISGGLGTGLGGGSISSLRTSYNSNFNDSSSYGQYPVRAPIISSPSLSGQTMHLQHGLQNATHGGQSNMQHGLQNTLQNGLHPVIKSEPHGAQGGSLQGSSNGVLYGTQGARPGPGMQHGSGAQHGLGPQLHHPRQPLASLPGYGYSMPHQLPPVQQQHAVNTLPPLQLPHINPQREPFYNREDFVSATSLSMLRQDTNSTLQNQYESPHFASHDSR